KRTFTNWINAQLAKRCSPSYVSDLFSDLSDGSRLLDLLEVMSGQGRGVFQQRANVETALDFLKKKSIKLVNINIPDIIDGRPSIILGLVWTIILRCHIEELASALSFSSRHSSLDSMSSLDSWSGSPVPASPVPAGRISPLHRHFRVSAKKALLMWVRDQCKKVHCAVNVKDFKSSWRSGEAFLAILCSLRPELVDLSRVQTRSNQENLEEAFHLAERELHIPRLLEPQDVDVKDPDEKSIMTYVVQFLQYSNDLPSPDDHLQVNIKTSFSQLVRLIELKKYILDLEFVLFLKFEIKVKIIIFSVLVQLWRCEADLEQSLPPPLNSVVLWLQRGEAALKDDGEMTKDESLSGRHKKPVLTGIRVTTKYEIIKLEYKESHHTVLDLLGVVKSKVQSWRTPYGSQQSVQVLLLDWHVSSHLKKQRVTFHLIFIIITTANLCFGKQDKSESELVKQMTAAAKEMMERVGFAWDVYNKNLTSLETWLVQSSADMSEWSSCHAGLNEAGNFLIEITEASISSTLVEQLSKVNLQWAERMKKTEIQSEPKVGSSSVMMLDSLTQEAGLLLRQPLEVASVPLKAVRQKLQVS
uniref:Calponin-homology (CH) domain-containing protein n=1 Tax=Xiphophorus maculatus TaxID=8083 RepID=M3ZVD0_XIPMA